MEILPVCFIPCESMVSPAAANTVTPASTRYLRRVKTSSRSQLSVLSHVHYLRCFELRTGSKNKARNSSRTYLLRLPLPLQSLRRRASSPTCYAASATSETFSLPCRGACGRCCQRLPSSECGTRLSDGSNTHHR